MLEIILALIPALFFLLLVYFKDKYKPEPFKYLFFAFFLGMLATIPASFLENMLFSNIKLNLPLELSAFIEAFFFVALIEEGIKFLFFRWFIWPKKYFDEPIDGGVYMVAIGMGFAFLENLAFIFNDLSHIWTVALMRAIMPTPAHFVFAVAMGYYFGYARFNLVKRKNKLMFIGFMITFGSHGFYDYLLMLVPKYPINLSIAILFIATYLIVAIHLINRHQKLSPFVKRYKWINEQKRKNKEELNEQLNELKNKLKEKYNDRDR
ncbi:MAG: PrsW family intramembrane metalloprotease [Bacteroidales bacterium]|nr:PrsW family intramembrane metalloprotease [Bacteroidales bacterium]